jgi:hypothetical protein
MLMPSARNCVERRNVHKHEGDKGRTRAYRGGGCCQCCLGARTHASVAGRRNSRGHLTLRLVERPIAGRWCVARRLLRPSVLWQLLGLPRVCGKRCETWRLLRRRGLLPLRCRRLALHHRLLFVLLLLTHHGLRLLLLWALLLLLMRLLLRLRRLLVQRMWVLLHSSLRCLLHASLLRLLLCGTCTRVTARVTGYSPVRSGLCFNAAPGRASVGLQRHAQRRAAPRMHLEKRTSGLWHHVRLLRVRRRVALVVRLGVSVRAALLRRRRVGR